MTDYRFHTSPVEQAIRKAMREGLFDNLPGEGKPLKYDWEENPNTPDDKRMAYKIMQDNDIAPDWMMMGDVLAHQQQKIRREIAKGLRAYRGTLHDADQQGDLGKRSRANRTWERLLQIFDEAVEQYNRNVLTYNLKVPPGVPKRHYMDIRQEVAKLEAD
jgi:hypothetical protein